MLLREYNKDMDRKGAQKTSQARSYGEQDENGVDLSLIRELLQLAPVDRLRRMDRATTDALRLRKYAREQR